MTRTPSARTRSDEATGAMVRASLMGRDRTYRARRVWHDVQAEGISCGLHRIARLMRQQAWRARPRRRGLHKDTGERSVIAADVLDRQSTADRPNKKWVACSAYCLDRQLDTDALMIAIWRRGKPDAVLHHSGQGSQYDGPPFVAIIAHPLATMAAKKPANQAILRI